MEEAISTAQSSAQDAGLYDAGRDAAQYAVDTSVRYGPEATQTAADYGAQAEAPGFGVGVALAAIVGAGLLAVWRSRDEDNAGQDADRYDVDGSDVRRDAPADEQRSWRRRR